MNKDQRDYYEQEIINHDEQPIESQQFTLPELSCLFHLFILEYSVI
jgi:hypothetical protein